MPAFNKGEEPATTFWRDKTGVEIDLLCKNASYNRSRYKYMGNKIGSNVFGRLF